MEEKAIKMIIYYVLGVYNDDKKTIRACIELNKLIIAMIKNEEKKADALINTFPTQHPVAKIYSELKDCENLLELFEYSKEKFEKANIDDDYLKNIVDDVEVENLSKLLTKEVK